MDSPPSASGALVHANIPVLGLSSFSMINFNAGRHRGIPWVRNEMPCRRSVISTVSVTADLVASALRSTAHVPTAALGPRDDSDQVLAVCEANDASVAGQQVTSPSWSDSD